MLISHNVIGKSGITFGTSGARGLVEDFSADVCAAFTVSFLETMRFSFKFDTVAIAIDNRPSSVFIAKACAAVVEQLGLTVIYYGVLPTPALAYQSMNLLIPSIMVTGSHIPFDRNGLKFYRPDGEISKADESSIINGQFNFLSPESMSELIVNDSASKAYISRYLDLFDSPWLKGKKIGIYQHSSAGRDLYPILFEQLGAEVVLIGRSDIFVPIDTEAVSVEDCDRAQMWTEEFNLDALFSTDGDGDRPMLADEHGHWLCGDILGLLSAKILNIKALSIPVSCNTGVELSEYFQFIMRTKIGSPYVIAGFSALKDIYESYAGFEANGGFLLGSDVSFNGKLLTALPTRDAVLPILMVLFGAKDKSISSLTQALPSRYTHSNRLTNFPVSKSKRIIDFGVNKPNDLLKLLDLDHLDLINVNSIDGLRLHLSDDSIVHLRPSGNAPEFRCYVESESKSTSILLNELVLSKIHQLEVVG